MRSLSNLVTLALALAAGVRAAEYNSFDGPGFPTCYDVTAVHNATSVDEMVSLVQAAAASGKQVRAGGKGHMWYDTQCADLPTEIIRTELVNQISDFDLPAGAESGTVVVEAGVTFFQLADYLHARGANIGTGLVNWNISLGGSVAMGAHRTSLREDAVVVGGVLSMDIIDGAGNIRTIERDESNDEWLAASTSLGLLGIIARLKMKIYPETVLYAMQKTLDEEDVLDGDIEALISPYLTANLWVRPYKKKFHQRYYDVVGPDDVNQNGLQSTFSVTGIEAAAAISILNTGKALATSNMLAEEIFFGIWEKPNFHTKDTNEEITTWPVTGYNYDVLIGGLYPDQKAEWDYGLRGYTLELAFPVPLANKMLKRVRELFDAQWNEKLIVMTSTYRSGINIKFGKPHFDLLGQVTTNTSDGADWSKGAIMFDFPSFRPNIGDQLRFNEPFYHNLSQTLINEFPCRPHWTKNTREVLTQSVKNLDPDHIARFKAVREDFDPKGIFRSVVGEIIGVY
ncbi:putative fad fmn-containing dehydrogenase [Diaporthe ampelina]|uniref:D-arabinono-1,4-lactone oxidase n=1 Tax=Diaporthe ampelina TaxID=1214573 RepID=A0A0G2FDM6_9PEZI|nr:putative fad fmn-containing dehydrogenase [Diaporthe ampelina]